MDISKFTHKPKLERIVLDDAGLVEELGEPIEFYMRDHIDINTYFGFFRAQQTQDSAAMDDIMRKIILKADGSPAIGSDEVLPVTISIALLIKVNEYLGKLGAKMLSTQETGQQPS